MSCLIWRYSSIPFVVFFRIHSNILTFSDHFEKCQPSIKVWISFLTIFCCRSPEHQLCLVVKHGVSLVTKRGPFSPNAVLTLVESLEFPDWSTKGNFQNANPPQMFDTTRSIVISFSAFPQIWRWDPSQPRVMTMSIYERALWDRMAHKINRVHHPAAMLVCFLLSNFTLTFLT
jgi:hypothetical protein